LSLRFWDGDVGAKQRPQNWFAIRAVHGMIEVKRKRIASA